MTAKFRFTISPVKSHREKLNYDPGNLQPYTLARKKLIKNLCTQTH